MKILIVNDYVDKTIGGVEIYMHQLYKLLVDRGHEVRITGGVAREAGAFRRFVFGWFSLKYKRLIGKQIREFKPDVIWAQSIVYNISPSFLLEAKKKKVPVILKLPNIDSYSYPKVNLTGSYRVLTFMKRLLHRNLVRKYVDFYIAPSENSANWLNHYLGVMNVRVIRNPVFWEVSDHVRESTGSAKRIVYVGMLEWYKGIDYLIKAFPIICEKLPDDDVFLDIIGDGGDLKRLQKLAAGKNLYGKVNFKGYIPHEQLKEEYAGAYVFVLPSVIVENAPIAPLESMSQGTPVVTTNLGGQAELVENGYNGFLVKPGDVHDLADKIIAILANSELRREMSKNSIEFAQRFSAEKHCTEIENFLLEVINTK